MTDTPEPSEMEDRIADAVIDFYSNHSSDGLERDAPRFTRAGLKLAISTAGLADLEANLAAAERERDEAREFALSQGRAIAEITGERFGCDVLRGGPRHRSG